jgi:hypothetical protein
MMTRCPVGMQFRPRNVKGKAARLTQRVTCA